MKTPPRTPSAAADHQQRYRRARRRYGASWVALLLLLAASAASAQLHLGAGNLFASLGIALLKAGIVTWIFMALREAGAMLRIAAAAGLGALLVLGCLSLADFGPRHNEIANWQSPQAIPPALFQNHNSRVLPGQYPSPSPKGNPP